jgi:hypothetical protein
VKLEASRQRTSVPPATKAPSTWTSAISGLWSSVQRRVGLASAPEPPAEPEPTQPAKARKRATNTGFMLLQPSRPARPDEMMRLPRTMEEALDLIIDDVNFVSKALYRALVPGANMPEPPPVRPRVPEQRPRASGSTSQRTASWQRRAGDAAQGEDDDEDEEEEGRTLGLLPPSPQARPGPGSILEIEVVGEADDEVRGQEPAPSLLEIRARRLREREEATEAPSQPIGLLPPAATPTPETPTSSPQPVPASPPPVGKGRGGIMGWVTGLANKVWSKEIASAMFTRKRLMKQKMRMDDRFLRTVNRKLKGDRVRIREFQLQTDRFRNSLISALVYYESVVLLFGSLESAEEILMPLMEMLPERSKRRDLAEVARAKRQKREVVSSPGPPRGSMRAAVGGTIMGVVSTGASWGRGLISAVASLAGNRTVELALLTESEDGQEESTTPLLEVEVVQPGSTARRLLGERNYGYAQMRLEAYRRGAITSIDLYKSLQKLCGADLLDSVVVDLISEIGDDRKAELLRTVHEGQMRSMGLIASTPRAPLQEGRGSSFRRGPPPSVDSIDERLSEDEDDQGQQLDVD